MLISLFNLLKYPKAISGLIMMLIASLSATIFIRIYSYSDLTLHADFIKQYVENKGPLPENFLYYLLVLMGAFANPSYLMPSTVTILTIAVLAKFLITSNYLTYENQSPEDKSINHILALVLVFSSAIYLPQYLFSDRFYLGSFTLNIWHNSTTIAVMPFAILLFQQTIKQIKDGYSTKRLIAITTLIVINALIKPSYLFVYIGALPLTLLLQKPNLKYFIHQMFPFVVAIAVVFILKILIYNNSQVASVEINPLLIYQHHHQYLSFWQLLLYLGVSIILGLLFPLVAATKQKITFGDVEVVFSSIAMLGAIAIYILFAETGERWWHGNFFWQIVISGYILFMVFARETFNQLNILKLRKTNILQISLGLHLLFGLIYVLRLMVTCAYM